MNRRQLFQVAATAGTGIAAARRMLAASPSAGNRTAVEIATDEDFWSAVRDEFTTDRTVINLNNGHVSPAPRTVQEAMRRYLDYSNMGPYHTMIQQLEKHVETARRMVAELAGVDPKRDRPDPQFQRVARNRATRHPISNPAMKCSPPLRIIRACSPLSPPRARREGIKVKTDFI